MSALNELSGVSTLVGTPKEVRSGLGGSHADQVLAVSFRHVGDADEIQALAENLSSIASLMIEVLKERQEKRVLERLADALSPAVPASPHLLKEAAMLTKARKAVLDSGDWLTANEVAEIANLSATNPSAQPNKWKKSGRLFAIQYGGIDYFPAYGLDKDKNFRPLKAIAQVIDVFKEYKDGWGMAFWFMSVNSFLGGKRPQDLLAIDSERVIAAARDEVEEITHG